jgi:hypothetical protein
MTVRYSNRSEPSRLLFGLVAAVVMAALSCCLLGALAALPALTTEVPPPPGPEPGQPDLTVIVLESFMNRMLAQTLPDTLSGVSELDVQPGNRLVVTTKLDLLLTDLDIVITLLFGVETGQARFTLESLEAGDYDLADLFDVNTDTLTEQMSKALQQQIVAGLGTNVELVSIVTTDDQLIIQARWVQ